MSAQNVPLRLDLKPPQRENTAAHRLTETTSKTVSPRPASAACRAPPGRRPCRHVAHRDGDPRLGAEEARQPRNGDCNPLSFFGAQWPPVRYGRFTRSWHTGQKHSIRVPHPVTEARAVNSPWVGETARHPAILSLEQLENKAKLPGALHSRNPTGVGHLERRGHLRGHTCRSASKSYPPSVRTSAKAFRR